MKKIILLFLLLPGVASAATLRLVEEPLSPGAGDTVEVRVLLDSDAPVNAFSGALRYPEGWDLTGISDGGSIVSAWVERPEIRNGTIEFAGVTAGGFAGRSGALFSVQLKARAGTARFALEGLTVLRNDGAGTPEPTEAAPLLFTVSSTPAASFKEPIDADPPEPFSAYAVDLEEAHALAYAAVDKGSGIDHYEVSESRAPAWLIAPHWIEAASPYVLKDQYRSSDVYIKAVDRAGNTRITVVHRAFVLRPLELLVGCMLIVCGSIITFWRRRSFARLR
jgi:hypothetical protein